MSEKNNQQIEDPNLNIVKKKLEQDNSSKFSTEEDSTLKKGTNPLLWNVPTYTAVGIDLENDDIENPNAYWENWAKTQEEKLN
jgi:hypothetical protein